MRARTPHLMHRPFQCQHCDKAFSQSSNLKRHERVHKSQRVSAPSPPPPQRRPSLKENEIRWRPPAAAVAESNTAAAAPSMSAMIAAALKQQAAYADRIHSALVGSSSPSRPRDHMHTSHQGRAIAGPSAPARNVASTMMSAVSSPRDSPRSFKVYTMSSPLRPLNEKCAQAMKVKLEVAGGATSSPSRPQRCSGGEDTFYNSDTHQLHHASSGRTNAIRCVICGSLCSRQTPTRISPLATPAYDSLAHSFILSHSLAHSLAHTCNVSLLLLILFHYSTLTLVAYTSQSSPILPHSVHVVSQRLD